MLYAKLILTGTLCKGYRAFRLHNLLTRPGFDQVSFYSFVLKHDAHFKYLKYDRMTYARKLLNVFGRKYTINEPSQAACYDASLLPQYTLKNKFELIMYQVLTCMILSAQLNDKSIIKTNI